MKKLFLFLIKFYRKYLSPLKSTKCPYYPTCSTYGLLAVQKYGAFKGCLLAFWRILRCNPFSHGGVDPVPEEGEPLFRRTVYRKKNFKKIPIKGATQ